MKKYFENKLVRIRCRKAYPEAHSNVIIGKVLEETDNYIVTEGKTFHFKRIIDGMRNQVRVGEVSIRATPWNNIEVIHWLGNKTDYHADIDFDQSGNLILCDKAKTVITPKQNGTE